MANHQAIDMQQVADSPASVTDDKPGSENSGLHKELLCCEAASTVADAHYMPYPNKLPYAPPKPVGSTLHSAGLAGASVATHGGSAVPDTLQDPFSVKGNHKEATAVGNWFRRAGHQIKRSLQTYAANVRRHPFLMLGPPLLLFTVCVALGVYGVVAGAHREAEDKRTVVQGSALDWSSGFKLSLENTFTPLVTLSIFIRQNPDFPSFAPRVPSIATDVLAQLPPDSIQELQVSPMGIISIIYPNNTNSTGRQGADIFAEASLRGGAITTLNLHSMLLNGPLYLINGGNFAAIVRLPIYIPNSTLNETFGTNKSLPTNCPTGLCWNPITQEKFWGFVTAIVPLDDLRAGTDSRLDLLKQKGYLWRLTRPYTSTEANPNNLTEYTFANSSTWPTEPVSVFINVSNAIWTVYLSPDDGWLPSWLSGIIVLVTMGSLVLALLVAVIMASWAQQKQLLGEVMGSNSALAATTRHLEEEKLRLDALLVRQYNLLSVLGGNAGKAGHAGSPSGSDTNSKEGVTLERIELMRRQLAVNTNSSRADLESIQTLDLLGEGTFGKVYKGLWRGTVVAVKIMLLPANMSGAEKREKMAVMEAAISSSLSHPNIVQTYTYAIRPVTENDPTMDGSLLVGSVNDSMNVQNSMIKSSGGTNAVGRDSSATNSALAVHSYEVRLVLEFCDRGCLRDALDDGAFMAATGLNYCAVLDVAADVAKAMLHLHSLNVLHADLKARNVMLKSDGSQGVVAKVADFGLSLKMDHLETHISAVYQGTMTHMAPEIMLEGRVSKAADVYAFGITMWELFTGGHAFHGVPRALMGHQITKDCLRPKFPGITPTGFRSLAERCWHPFVDQRPDFQEVLDELLKLRQAEVGTTSPLTFDANQKRPVKDLNPALPATSGVSPHAPKFEVDKGNDSDLEGVHVGGGRGLTTGGTVVRQRPVTLPKIHEHLETTGGSSGENTVTVVQEGLGGGTTSKAKAAPPKPSQHGAAAAEVTTKDQGDGDGDGHVRGAPTRRGTFGSLPSGVQVMDASAVGDSPWN